MSVCDGEITCNDLPIDMLSGEASPTADDAFDLKSVERNHIIKSPSPYEWQQDRNRTIAQNRTHNTLS